MRIRPDVWAKARREAFENESKIVDVLDAILRQHFGLPAAEEAEAQ